MIPSSIDGLAPYQQRVVQERTELDERRHLLSKFILSDTFIKLPDIQRALLIEQQAAMTMYSTILSNRIQFFLGQT